MAKLNDVILNELQSSRKNVNRLLSLGILFALIGHFYVVEPYFQYKKQERTTQSKLKVQSRQLEELSKRFERIKTVSESASQTLNRLESKIDTFPDRLRDTLPTIREALSLGSFRQTAEQAGYSLGQGLSLPDSIRTFEDGVTWYVGEWFTLLMSELNSGVVIPVLRLDLDSKETREPELTEMMELGLENMRTFLAVVPPDFWHTYAPGKVGMAQDLLQEMRESFGAVEKRISELLKKTETTMNAKKAELERSKRELEDLKHRRTELLTRIKSLELPLGRIPVSLPDLIQLFPLLVVVLVVMVTSGLNKGGRLHRAIWREFTKTEEDVSHTEFHQFTDCWYLPPYVNIFQPLLLIGWLVLCTLIIVRASLLVVGEPSMFVFVTRENQTFNQVLFIGIYLIGIVIVIICAWFIRKVMVHVPGR